jgi:hypothetical protein
MVVELVAELPVRGGLALHNEVETTLTTGTGIKIPPRFAAAHQLGHLL